MKYYQLQIKSYQNQYDQVMMKNTGDHTDIKTQYDQVMMKNTDAQSKLCISES